MPCGWNKVGLLDLPSPGISAAALCAGPGHWGMNGILFVTAPILPEFVASLDRCIKDADDTMQCFVWHKDQKAVCQCLAAILNLAVEVQPDELQLSFQMQRQAAFDAVPLDPRSCPGPGVKLWTYRRWFSRPAHQVCPVYWEVPMCTAKLQRILRFRMGSHLLPIEQGRHLRLPRHRRVCRLCHTGALGDERHMLLECPALADLRDEYSPLVADCSGVMARLVWARNQPMVSRYIIACLDRKSC